MRSAGYRPRARSPVLMRRQPQPLRLGFKRAHRVEARAGRNGQLVRRAEGGGERLLGSVSLRCSLGRRQTDKMAALIELVAEAGKKGTRGYLGHA
jgi:hypothetical protein